MSLRMKSFSIKGVHRKNRFSGGGEVHKKAIYMGDCLKKGRLDSLQV